MKKSINSAVNSAFQPLECHRKPKGKVEGKEHVVSIENTVKTQVRYSTSANSEVNYRVK